MRLPSDFSQCAESLNEISTDLRAQKQILAVAIAEEHPVLARLEADRKVCREWPKLTLEGPGPWAKELSMAIRSRRIAPARELLRSRGLLALAARRRFWGDLTAAHQATITLRRTGALSAKLRQIGIRKDIARREIAAAAAHRRFTYRRLRALLAALRSALILRTMSTAPATDKS